MRERVREIEGDRWRDMGRWGESEEGGREREGRVGDRWREMGRWRESEEGGREQQYCGLYSSHGHTTKCVSG